MRCKIGRNAAENGNTKAAKQFNVKESSVRHFKKLYYLSLKENGGNPDKVTFPDHGSRGRPLKLGKLDNKVQMYVKKLRAAGGIVNKTVVISAATGIVEALDPSLLQQHGGHINLGNSWAESILRRMGYVHRKGTKAARKLPPDFTEIKSDFLKRIKDTVTENNIPDELIVNIDQTGSKLVPCSEWTLEKEGERQVSIKGLDDKREITILLGISMSGSMVPPQVIYAGKTNKCHAEITFPQLWNITHSSNHWSNSDTMKEYCNEVLIPYFEKEKASLDLPPEQTSLLVLDIFAAHRTNEFLNLLKDANIKVIFVPAGCTGELQPLDVSVNGEFKHALKGKFSSWYATQVAKQLHDGVGLEDVNVNFTSSLIKPKHANWLISVIHDLQQKKEVILSCWKKPGIYASVHPTAE